ncbi:MAG: GNAT family N-acetyltransferase [Dehalococcoidales bacterium]|nr:GNAT family N-acetyltransferase [Dehalococcoidales bacterium]
MVQAIPKKEPMRLAEFETQVLLKDGTSMLLRPIKVSDAKSLTSFLGRLSANDKYLRFQHISRDMYLDSASRFCCTNQSDTCAFVAEVLKDSRKEIVATGKYYRLPDKHSAEVILAVQDDYQGRGLGTAILEQLMNVARQNDIDTFKADVLSCDTYGLSIFKNYGFNLTREIQDNAYRIVFPITLTPVMAKKEEERGRISMLASLRSLLKPQSIALIGASRHPGTLGHTLLQCLVQNGFTGKVYPVNPNTQLLMSLKTYPSVLDITGDVDMAVIAVPARVVAKVAADCGHKGVHTVVVISDGFSETGPEGASREKELRDVVLGHGMRMVGPNCMGVINTDPSVKMNATFSPVFPPAGNVAFLSQSGAMGLIVLQYAKNLDIGISTFVSVGNRADISSNDLLEFWEQDPSTDVILLYLESFGNPRKFSHIARRVTKKKPIVVIKGGSTQAGSRAATSHTGAMATSDVLSDVMFHHAGMIRVNLMEEMFGVAALLSNQPLPRGRNLVIVTNGGGPGIIAADAAARNGLSLPQMSEELEYKLKSVLKREVAIRNPFDTTAGADAEEFRGILRLLAADKNSDAVLVIFIPPIVGNTKDYEDAIREVAEDFWKQGKPLLACFLGQRGLKARLGTHDRSVPSFPFPEEAIAALARAVEYAETRKKPAGKIPEFKGIKRDEARKIIGEALARSTQRPLFLEPKEITGVLACYGIKLVETTPAKTAARAAALAAKMGFPVAVKLDSSTITHKSDVGGVVLDLNSADEVKKAFRDVRNRLKKIGRQDEMQGVMVQKMVKEGIEAIAGVTHDPAFGELIMFGSGGVYAELMKDTVLMLNPITDADASEMINSLKLSELFRGFRGSPPADTEAVQDLLLRLSAMVEDIPQIDELDFNPVKVMSRGKGYRIVDARIMLS